MTPDLAQMVGSIMIVFLQFRNLNHKKLNSFPIVTQIISSGGECKPESREIIREKRKRGDTWHDWRLLEYEDQTPVREMPVFVRQVGQEENSLGNLEEKPCVYSRQFTFDSQSLFVQQIAECLRPTTTVSWKGRKISGNPISLGELFKNIRLILLKSLSSD